MGTAYCPADFQGTSTHLPCRLSNEGTSMHLPCRLSKAQACTCPAGFQRHKHAPALDHGMQPAAATEQPTSRALLASSAPLQDTAAHTADAISPGIHMCCQAQSMGGASNPYVLNLLWIVLLSPVECTPPVSQSKPGLFWFSLSYGGTAVRRRSAVSGGECQHALPLPNSSTESATAAESTCPNASSTCTGGCTPAAGAASCSQLHH